VPRPHLPHGWDAGVLFEEKSGVLLCSDLFHQLGDVESVTSADGGRRKRQTRARLLPTEKAAILRRSNYAPRGHCRS
jgi:hypothetical protein